MDRTHIFIDQTFWHHFQKQVHAKGWKCEFPSDVLLENLIIDSELYKDDTVFRQRRERIIPWLDNDHQWNRTLLGACQEIAIQRSGIHSQILKNLHLFDALKDFADHLHYFYMVASTMSLQGYSFQPVSQYSSKIHDLDKLDPVMLLGYSERFEDNISTSVWNLCVERHVHLNPHHQVHAMWHESSEDPVWRRCRVDALREMVCDKVSRRLQKSLDGVVSDDMWDVDVVYFKGLPDRWMERANDMMKMLKQHGISVEL